MKLLALAALLSLLLPLSASDIPQAPQPQVTLADFYNATVVIYRQGEGATLSPSCTATSIMKVEKGYFFVTASHCIDPSVDYYVSSDDQSPKVLWLVEGIDKGNIAKGNDFAVLFVPTTQVFPVVPMGADPVNLLGEPVVSVTAPLGMGKQVLRGTIANPSMERSMPVRVNGKLIGNWKGAMLVQMPGVNPASSGSALICSNQHAICGVIVGVVAGPLGQEAVALPISGLLKEIESHLPKK